MILPKHFILQLRKLDICTLTQSEFSLSLSPYALSYWHCLQSQLTENSPQVAQWQLGHY